MNTIRMVRSLAALFLSAVFFGSPGYAKDIGTVGAVYPIAEVDAVEALEAKAREVNWKQYFSDERIKRAAREFKPEDLKKLPPARKNGVYTVSVDYTLEFDITDKHGNVIYPKGFRFNPLDYVELPSVLVVIDGEDSKQVAWYKQSEYYNDMRAKLLITGGSYSSLMSELKRPVFFADASIVSRLKLRTTPSVVRQKGPQLEIKEVALETKAR